MKAILKSNMVECLQRPEHIAVNKVQYRPPKTINITTFYPVGETKCVKCFLSIAPYTKNAQFNPSDVFLKADVLLQITGQGG